MLQKKTVQLDIPDTKYHNANIRIKQLCPCCNLNRLEERIIVCLKHSLPYIQRKAPLQALHICRKCRQTLYKLKADLQNLGLSRKQVHQGLIQIATKPHVVLTRQIPYRRYRFKNLSKDEREKNIIDNLRRNALNLCPQIEDIHKSNTTEIIIKEESKYIKKADGVTAHETALISSNRELFIPNICYKLKNPLATMHSFDETLKQLDESISSKMEVDEKSTNVKKLENDVVSSKKCDKDENHHCIREHKDTQKIQKIPNLISDKVGSNKILMFNKYRKKHVEPKLKLNSFFAKKASDSIKSDDYKKVDNIKSTKSDIGKKLHNGKKLIDMKVNSIPDKNTYSKHEDSTLNCSHNTEEVTKMRENTDKRKLHKLIVSDKHKEIIKKKRKIKDRFRTYFGDCISISEDEQEQNIIEERFRKTRKKDFVDSCKSEVHVAERNITMTAAHVDIIQKSNEDTSQGIIANVDISHKPNDDISQGTITNLDMIHKLNKNTSQETIVNVDTNYGLNEDTSQRIIVNVDVIHESSEDTFQGIIANVDTSHKSNEGTSQGTIGNIIQKSDEDTSQRIIVNVDVIHESNEDTSQGIIANVDTSHKSNEGTSQGTIDNIIQKSDEDRSQGTIVNVDTIHESNEVTSNANNKSTSQIESATNFVEIECNKLQNNTYENKTHDIEIEKKELSRNKKFTNFSEKNNIEKSKHASSVTDMFQITEQSKISVSTAKMKATSEINNILPSDIPEICIPSLDTVAISKNFSGSERSNLDTKDFNDLHMRFLKTCQIGSNGNILSIREIDMNGDVGESSNLKKLSEIQINCNQSITEEVLNYIEEDKKVQLSSNTNKTDNVISTNNISNVKNNENELAVENSGLSISEKKDIQSNKLPQAKLRVLTCAELGARWCPTPVNSVTPTVVQFSHNTETQTAPEIIVSTPAPVSETASRTNSVNMKNCHMDPTFSKSLYVIFKKIRSIIWKIRKSSITDGRTQLQDVSQSVSPNHNILQLVQQNMNSTYMSQGTQLQGVSRSVAPNRNIPQPVQQNMNSTHMSQGTQLQGVSRSVAPNRNIPQPVQTMVAANISRSVLKNSQYIEQKHQKVIPQKRIPMEVSQNRTSEQVAQSQQLKKSTLRRLKKKENLQVSLESTTNLFDILKYISDIQKLILLKQLDYYFGCTTWLQQQFTSEKWQEIHSERSLLLHFQTLLKHLVEKTIKNLLPDNYQTNILKNIEIDVPKVIQITVKGNNGICCQVEASKSNQEQYNAMNIKQNCTNYEENSNITITQNQCEKEHEATDNSQTNSSSIKKNLQSHQTSDVDVCQENKVERKPNSSRNIYNSKTKEQNLDESKKITENIPQVVTEKLSTLSNMKLLNKDTLQQLNSHLVTVEISSKNDQVTVVDTNANSENTSKSIEPEEYQEHQHLKGTITDDLTVSSFKSPNNIEYFNNKESHNISLERSPTTYIKDVRSISMEAYLRIGVTNNVPANTMEENIEEEEIKICLYCGKPSTVACIICLEAKYCSKECSQLHWGDHYKDCSPVERSISS
ncbi:uncharacterized protein LOC100648741 isoform X4 [Bombus terrestris]|uniref:Uncharacterized protein LOC100648741 isoform X4 n=1 Tax=Bombus terrestris TaxID=30195 RepID=A0A9C6S690_BOMTE|nr:uncharacterized protein LOC100648741 isoform X4 [Bombus terrestris]